MVRVVNLHKNPAISYIPSIWKTNMLSKTFSMMFAKNEKRHLFKICMVFLQYNISFIFFSEILRHNEKSNVLTIIRRGCLPDKIPV